jgi:hypothetical protein
VSLELFGPFNETDWGPPEGPKLGGREFVAASEAIAETFRKNNLSDVRLVLPESSHPVKWFDLLLGSPVLEGKIGVCAAHAYYQFDGTFAPGWLPRIQAGPNKNSRFWLGEYGTLDQGLPDQWGKAVYVFDILMRGLKHGFSAALNWDAYDNYHWHDRVWTRYGLIEASPPVDTEKCYHGGTYTPKKRYYACKQAYHFVRPGFLRLSSSPCDDIDSDLYVLAFASPDGKRVSAVGMNRKKAQVDVVLELSGFDKALAARPLDVYWTTATEDCVKGAAALLGEDNKVKVTLPADCIFTITNVQ